MNFTIKLKLLAFSIMSVLLALGIAASGYIGIVNVDGAMDEIVDNSSALRNHLAADMMHDALRADVLAALLASETNDQEMKKVIEADLEEHANTFKSMLDKNMEMDIDVTIKDRLASTRPALSAYRKTSEEIVQMAFVDREKANAKMAQFKKDFDALAVEMEALSDLIESSTGESQKNGDAAVVLSKEMIMIISVAAIGILITVSLFLSSRITKPLAVAVSEAQKISEGDLTGRIVVNSSDETGQLLSALNEMKTRLLDIVTNVRNSTNEVTMAASEISKGNMDLSQRTEEQASSLEETASSMEEMTSTVKQNADNANQANQLAVSARNQAEDGGKIVSEAVIAMGQINKSSSKIADILEVVEEIAFQTNLLALNAAVEAARAGEQGRGFAVVATEVRTLAQRSAESAKEIKGLIEDSVSKVKAGSELVDKSGKALEDIVTSVKKVTDIVADIAAAGQEQSSGIEQVNKAVMQMDEMTQQNAALVEEAASASKSMEDQAEKLNQMMSFFKVEGLGSMSAGQSGSVTRTKAAPVHHHPAKNKPAPAAQEQGFAGDSQVRAPMKKTGTHDDTEWQEF